VRFEGPGTPAQPLPGATTIRTGGDGHETTHTWNAERSAYIGIDGDGAHDELRYDSAESEAESEWVWTDGSTRVTERYSNSTSSSMTGRMVQRTDISGSSVVLRYDDGGRLNRIRDAASSQELRLTYGLVNGVTRVRRLESRTLIEDASGRPTEMLGGALLQVTYNYDGSSRLTTVTRYLTPDGGAGASAFVTSYAYVGATTRIGSLSQSDGTSVFFGYDSAGRVSTVNDHSAATNAQLSFSYRPATDSTEITDGNGQIWTYRFDRRSQQLTEVLTPLVSGGAGRPLETRKLDECDRCREWHQSPSLIPNFARDP
jgi:hypothetical protein